MPAVIQHSFAVIDQASHAVQVLSAFILSMVAWYEAIQQGWPAAGWKGAAQSHTSGWKYLPWTLNCKQYEERLRLLQLPLLYYWLQRGDMIHTYQLFHGAIDANPCFIFILADRTTRPHLFKLHKHSPSSRVWRLTTCSIVTNLIMELVAIQKSYHILWGLYCWLQGGCLFSGAVWRTVPCCQYTGCLKRTVKKISELNANWK